MDQKLLFGGLTAYAISYLDSILCYWKVFKLHAILHDAAAAVRSHTGKRPGYCYMTGQDPNSCLLGPVTGLLLCFYVNIFVSSSFKYIDFSNSMSLIVLDVELTEKNIIKELGLLMVRYKNFHIVRQRLLNLINRQHGAQVIYMELRGVVESRIMRNSLLFSTT